MFPNYLDGARVRYYTNEDHFGIVDYNNGEKIIPMHYLAICSYANEQGFYLFFCDEKFNTVSDYFFDTIEECKEVAKKSKENIEWMEVIWGLWYNQKKIGCLEKKMNKITCICLGVRNMEKALKFYRDGLGYKTDCKEDNPPVCFFNTPGTKFELFPLDALAKDIDENNPPTETGFSGITLTYNVKNKEDVDSVIDLVRKAGGTIVKEPQEVFWGGYHAYFSDLDGYYWEVSWGPDFQFDEDGLLKF